MLSLQIEFQKRLVFSLHGDRITCILYINFCLTTVWGYQIMCKFNGFHFKMYIWHMIVLLFST